MTTVGWTVVVPVKGTGIAKSRLAATPTLARALALDTVEAVLAATHVARVIVVTPAVNAEPFAALGADVLEDPRGGLAAAVGAGIAAAGARDVAVLLGDLPALRPDELDAALEAASGHPLAFVADSDDIGSSLVTAREASAHQPAFGTDSRRAHLAAGYVELALPRESGLRRDVDTREHLDLLASAGRLGTRTSSAVRGTADESAESVA